MGNRGLWKAECRNAKRELPFFSSLLIFSFFLCCHWFFLLGVGVFSEAIITVNDFSLLAIVTFAPGDCSQLSGLWQALTAISSFLLPSKFLGEAQKENTFSFLFLFFLYVSPFPLLHIWLPISASSAPVQVHVGEAAGETHSEVWGARM